MSVLGNLEPKAVFGYFEDICNIPHGSGNMEKISQFCADFAKEHGLEYIVDDMKNVIIIKEATPGYEEAEPLIIQGHLDMVCEKRSDKEKDFLTEGLDLCTNGELIWADGTTLGGDDGIAVAYALALLAAKDLVHPRLEVVLTVDEETGLYGAEAIDLSMLKGKELINLDSEEEGIFTVGCAGGLTLKCSIPMFTDEVEGIGYQLKVTGLSGGHSGVEIHKGRANANVLLGRVLQALNKETGADIIKMAGGAKDNAIPRYGEAEILVSEELQEKLEKTVKNQEVMLKNEFHASDAEITLILEKKGKMTAEVLDATSKMTVLHALNNIPNGIQAYSMDIEGLVETSLNMGIMKQDGETMEMSFAVRSSIESAKYYLTDRVVLFVEMLGGDCEIQGDYPGWEFKPESGLRETFIRVYKEMYQKEPVVAAIHAGLECGLFTKKIDGLDSISIGPNMHNVHTCEETLEVGSVQRTWEFLCRVIAEK